MTPKVDTWQSILDSLSLKHAGHKSREAGMCAMEAVAYIAGERHSDHPACACPVITEFLINWNDALPNDAERDRLLKPLLPLVVDTRGTPEVERRRAFMAMDWFVRVHVPAWFDLTPALKPSGDALRALDEINTIEALRAATGRLQEASGKAAAAWAAAGAAARDAAGGNLAPTVAMLQASAQDLVRRMCAAR